MIQYSTQELERIELVLPKRMQHLHATNTRFLENFVWHPKAHRSVNNCRDAIRVRGIALHQELKSILLKLRSGYFLFHLRGSEEIEEKKVNQIHRKLIGNKTKIRLASNEELASFNAIKGTVNPLLADLWNLHHIISPTIFQGEFVWTNDGELDGYVKFNPYLLLETPHHSVEEFARA